MLTGGGEADNAAKQTKLTAMVKALTMAGDACDSAFGNYRGLILFQSRKGGQVWETLIDTRPWHGYGDT